MSEQASSTVTVKHALKEWAVVVDALVEGGQIITLRKGGIHESGGGLRTELSEALLLPTFEHQHAEGIRPEERHRFARIHPPEAGVFICPAWVRVIEAIPLKGENAWEAAWNDLAAETIWTGESLRKRAEGLPGRPLVLLALEVRRLRSPVRLEAEPGLEGCRSLVTLSKPLEIPLGAPAAADFTQRWQEIRDRLLDRNGEPAVGG